MHQQMKAVILDRGLGTGISAETHLKTKPMIKIGGYPILGHIMKIYSSHGRCTSFKFDVDNFGGLSQS